MQRYHKNQAQELAAYQQRKAKNPRQFKGYRLKRSFGITLGEYERLLEQQGRCCAICQLTLGQHRQMFNKDFPVDHDHVTGKIRGLLCNNCNTGLGMFRDDAERCNKAAEYLRSSSS